MKHVVITATATRQLAQLPATLRTRIVAKIESYAATGGGDVKRLRGRDGARLRVGNYRVIISEDPVTLRVLAVGHRRDIYT